MSRKVLITGATGFVGSSLVRHYVEADWEVHGTYLQPMDDSSWLPNGVHLHEIDLHDASAVGGLIQSVKPEVVQHLAAQSSVSRSWHDPMATLEGNAAMQQYLLDAVRQLDGKRRVVVVGSAEEYGPVRTEHNPITESQELRPASPYALSKVVQDLMGLEYVLAHRMDVVRVRPFLQLGPRRSADFVAGSFARQVAEISLGNREPVIEVGSVDLVRDFLDVRDVAAALYLTAERGVSGEVYNIASGEGHTLREMLLSMLEMSNITATIRQRTDLIRAGESHILIGDSTKLRETTGWAPHITWEQSVRDTLAYWQERCARAEAEETEIV